jgi:hypothetical protein
VLVQYLGKIPKPEEIKLYTAYNNRECLHCHAGMRKYEEASSHHKNPEMLAQAATNQLSCISSGCHDTVHDVANLKDATFWTADRRRASLANAYTSLDPPAGLRRFYCPGLSAGCRRNVVLSLLPRCARHGALMLELLPWVLIHVADRDYPIKKVCRILNFWFEYRMIKVATVKLIWIIRHTANSWRELLSITRYLGSKSRELSSTRRE